MALLSSAAVLLGKELRTEFRSRELLTTTTVFVLIVIVLFSFSFDPTSEESRRFGAGLLWLAFLFAASLMLQPCFLREQSNDTLCALRLSGSDPFAIFLAKGSETERRNALSVSLLCSRRKHGCNIKDAAKRNASQRRPAPNRLDSSEVGSKEKLKSTMTIRTKTVVVVSSSRERNSVRSSLPSRTAALESSAIHAFAKARTERKLAPARVSATTAPASSWIARVASVATSDSPCRLIKIVRPESLN